jgi:hypothetical protein
MEVFKSSIVIYNKARSTYIINIKTRKEIVEDERTYVEYSFIDEESIKGILRISYWKDGDKTLSIIYNDLVVVYYYRTL